MKTLTREQLTLFNKSAVIINQWNSNLNVERCNIVAMTIGSYYDTGDWKITECWKMNLIIWSKMYPYSQITIITLNKSWEK